MKTAIVGGGAAGFFLAVCLSELFKRNTQKDKTMSITVFEKSDRMLAKTAISGGGRCNCTNTFEFVKDLSLVYPRGHRLMKKLFNVFSPDDAYNWFVSHGVKLKTEEEGRIFPVSDDSRTIVNMFLHYAEKYGVHIKPNSKITSLSQLKDFDFVAITCGGLLHNQANPLTEALNSQIIPSVPSLFAMKTNDENLKSLAGITVSNAVMMIARTKIKASGNVLISHQGITGPCILRLSSYAARVLNECNYKTNLIVNWVNLKDSEVINLLNESISLNPNKVITNWNNFSLPQRFWMYIINKVMPNRSDIRYKDLNKKEINRLVNALCNYELHICGRNTNKEEFVSCGGVSLDAVDYRTMQLKTDKHIFLAGEVLDIDGITGGYNFQAAWTTAFIAAQGIYNTYQSIVGQ